MHQVRLCEDAVVVSDVEPQTKRSRGCYERVAPNHIPRITVEVLTKENTEKLSVVIPLDVAREIPFLRDAVMSRSNAEAFETSIIDGKDGNRVLLDAPGGVWGLLVVLRAMLDPDVDMDDMLLAQSNPPLPAEAMEV